jgi:hypothetical protein
MGNWHDFPKRGAMTMYTQVWDHMNSQVSETMILRDEDQAHIPFDPDNTDYQEYLAWLDEGNEPAPYAPPATTLPAPSATKTVTRTVTRT